MPTTEAMAKFILRKHGEGVKEATSTGVSPVTTRKMRVPRIALGSPPNWDYSYLHPASRTHEQLDEGLCSIRLSHGHDVVCAWLDCH